MLRKLLTAILITALLTVAGLLAACAKSPATKPIAINQSLENDQKILTMPTADKTDKNELPPLDSSKIPTVTYCELIKNAADYDKKIVRIRAIYFSGFEKIYIYDDRCKLDQPPAAPREVPAETWAQQDKTFVSQGDSTEAKLNRGLKGFGRKDVTVVGRFYSTNEEGDPGKPNLFGHMNCCRFQFLIMRVENVVELENKTAKAQNDYGATVKFAPHQKIDFADFTLEFYEDLNLIVAIPQPDQKLPKYAFRAERAEENVMIYGNSEPNDNTPLKFAFGGAHYLLESGVSDKSGKLASNELIVRKIS